MPGWFPPSDGALLAAVHARNLGSPCSGGVGSGPVDWRPVGIECPN